MRLRKVARGADYDGHIGLGLGVLSQRQRELSADVEPHAEKCTERVLRQTHAGSMAAVLRWHRDNLPRDQLDPLIRAKDTPVGGLLILIARPPAQLYCAHLGLLRSQPSIARDGRAAPGAVSRARGRRARF